ncbi:MAG: hypothetical protein KAG66_00560 [Methylococcales bacterium]|nr:hypothetical protein [Methylococcales bacterium]
MPNTLTKLKNITRVSVPDLIEVVPARIETECHPETTTTRTSGQSAQVSSVEKVDVTQLANTRSAIDDGGSYSKIQTGFDSLGQPKYQLYKIRHSEPVAPVITTKTITVCNTTTIPGYTRRTPRPDVYVDIPEIGWTGSALSRGFFTDDGVASFSIPEPNAGAVVGLNQWDGVESTGYFDIDFGFIFTQGNSSVMERGVIVKLLGSFVTSDVFSIKRVDGKVSYLVNDVEVHVSGKLGSTQALYLDTSLYMSGDRVLDATIVPIETASDPASDPASYPLQVAIASSSNLAVTQYRIDDAVFAWPLAFESTSTMVEVRFRILSPETFSSTSQLSGGVTRSDTGVSVFPALSSNAFEGADGQGVGVLSALQSYATAGAVVIRIGSAVAVLPPLSSQSYGLAGGTNYDEEQSLVGLRSNASEFEYSESVNTLAPLAGLAGGFPVGMVGAARLFDRAGRTNGSSILLSTGRHLLTAAHVVEGWSDFNRIDVDFITDPGVVLPTYRPYRVTIHPSYEANGLQGVDLAIVELTTFVDPIVRRHALYTDRDELGRTFERTSFSTRVHPQSGAVSGAGWDLQKNRFDAIGTSNGTLSGGSGLLWHDWDSGLQSEDAFDAILGLPGLGVEGEFGVSPGDSGGGALLDDKVAGVVSFMRGVPTDVNPEAFGTYGEIVADVRVSSYVDWVQANSNTTIPYNRVDPAIPTIPIPLRAANSIVDVGLFDFEVEAYGSGAVASAGDIELLDFEVEAYSAAQADLELLDFEVEATATQYILATAEFDLLGFEVEATGETGAIGTADFEFGFEFEVAATSGSYAGFDLLDFEVEATATSYGVGSADLGLLDFEVAASGETRVDGGYAEIDLLEFETVYGYAELDLFGLVVDAEGGEVSASTPLKKAYAINVAHRETTLYPDYAFNQIVRLNGLYYGVRPDGLYLLEGPDDDGSSIQATIQTADMDFGTARHKRVPYAYLDTTDTTTIEPYTEERRIGKYTSSFKGRRTRLARGARGRFWSFKVANVDGAPLDLRSLELYTNAVGRKV